MEKQNELIELFKEKVNQFDELMCYFDPKVGSFENSVEEFKQCVNKFEELVYNNEYTLKKLREENSGDIFISIHLNSFPQASCEGAQTFYANNDESKKLAEKIQKNMVLLIKEMEKHY